MRLPLLLYPNKNLSEISVPVDPDYAQSEDFKFFLDALRETLIWFRGVGISAVQTGFLDRVFIMRTRKNEFITFVNPIVKSTDGELTEMEEGCLSIPGVVEKVKRYPNIVISALDIDSSEQRLYDLEGIEAQCAQHEMEHLDGKMLTDGLGRVARDIVRRKIQKQVRLNPLFKELR